MKNFTNKIKEAIRQKGILDNQEYLKLKENLVLELDLILNYEPKDVDMSDPNAIWHCDLSTRAKNGLYNCFNYYSYSPTIIWEQYTNKTIRPVVRKYILAEILNLNSNKTQNIGTKTRDEIYKWCGI